MRFVRTLISLGFVLFGVVVLVVAAGAYLTATGRSVPAIRAAAASVGRLTAGQSTEQMAVSVVADPAERRFDAVARVRVRAVDERRRFYFLLDDGLALDEVWQESADGRRMVLDHHRLWLLVAVELPESIDPGTETTLGFSYRGDPTAGISPFGFEVFESDQVVLGPTDLWYPADQRSFFSADVEVTLPPHLTLVHAGTSEAVGGLGSRQRRRWSSGRPTAGLALVAGRFSESSVASAGVSHHAYVGEGIDLDGARLATAMARAFDRLGAVYGAAGASRQALFVSRSLPRPIADGTGVVGLAPSSFRAGDYGFAALAEGIARTWWGGVVAAAPTAPEAGGAWIVDGFAANAARGVIRDEIGADAAFRWQRGRMFDPTIAGALDQASVVDAEIEPSTWHTLAGKASWVVAMLERKLGGQAFAAAARSLLETHRNQMIDTATLASTLGESSAADLTRFFSDWVEGIGQVDLSLDAKGGGGVLANHDIVPVKGEIELWRVPPGSQPVEQKISLGDSTPLGNAERLVVDPRGGFADMRRGNNVLPREAGPRLIARSPRGAWLLVEGEPHDWAQARIRIIDESGRGDRAWDFDRGVVGRPRWSADGTRVLAVEPPRGGGNTLYELHPSDGTQRVVGGDTVADAGVGGVAAARGDRLVWLDAKGSRELARVDGRVEAPRISAEDASVAYAAVLGSQMELRLVDTATGDDRLLMTWPATELDWRWSPDASRLFAVLGGDWDWQLWEIPVDGTPRALVREAAGIRTLAVSPDGNRIALAAQGKLDERFERYEVFVVDRADPTASQRYTVAGQNVVDIAWRDDESLFAIVSDPTYPMLPSQRTIKVLQLADGSVVDFRG